MADVITKDDKAYTVFSIQDIEGIIPYKVFRYINDELDKTSTSKCFLVVNILKFF